MKNPSRIAFSLALYLLFTFSASAQDWKRWGPGVKGEGPIVRKEVKVAPFKAIELAISGNVYLREGSRQSVEVESHKNIIEVLSTDVMHEEWKIHFGKRVRGYQKFNVYITLPELHRVAVSGSGNVRGDTPFNWKGTVRLAISGSGDIQIGLNSTEVDALVSGSGDITVSGTSGRLQAAISGSGNIRAGSLVVDTATARISGSGDCSTHPRNELEATISGSGNVTYYGKPKVRSSISGSGNIIPK
jgi:hypothetical protein